MSLAIRCEECQNDENLWFQGNPLKCTCNDCMISQLSEHYNVKSFDASTCGCGEVINFKNDNAPLHKFTGDLIGENYQ